MEIILESVSKELNHTVVLDHVSCEFSSGNIYGVVGRNGSGKTMLLRTIAGLIIPTSGTVSFDGKRLHKDISIPPSLGLIIEKPEFISYLTGLENLKQLAAINKIVSEETIKEYMQLRRDLSRGFSAKAIGIYHFLQSAPCHVRCEMGCCENAW